MFRSHSRPDSGGAFPFTTYKGNRTFCLFNFTDTFNIPSGSSNSPVCVFNTTCVWRKRIGANLALYSSIQIKDTAAPVSSSISMTWPSIFGLIINEEDAALPFLTAITASASPTAETICILIQSLNLKQNPHHYL